jgi:hypothetical protein
MEDFYLTLHRMTMVGSGQRRGISENKALTCGTGILFSEMHHLSVEENFCPRRHPANTLRNICKCFMDLEALHSVLYVSYVQKELKYKIRF